MALNLILNRIFFRSICQVHMKTLCAIIVGCICALSFTQCQSYGRFWEVGPEISTLSPASGAIGEMIEISGKRFAPTSSGNSVRFNGVAATVVSASETKVTVTIPVGATSGAVTVATSDGTGTSPQAFTIVKYFVYVANGGAASLSAFALDITTGALTQISGSPFAVGSSPEGLQIHPSGKYIYSTLSASGVAAYALNNTGAPTIIGSAIATGTGPTSVTLDPAGKFLYVANTTSNNVSPFTIGSSGALTANGAAQATGTNPIKGVVAPSGKYLYIANDNVVSNNLSGFSIDAAGAIASIGKLSLQGRIPGPRRSIRQELICFLRIRGITIFRFLT
ncbi:MAG: beta-propeller fold lactonase family protein [Mesorhizobium sp.]